MDFDKLNTKADAEAGAVLHYTHPQLGHLLYSGEGSDDYGRLVDSSKPHEPVAAVVRGTESDTVRAVITASGANAVKGIKEDDGFSFAAALIVELRGVTRDGRRVSSAPDDIRWFFGRAEHFALQTMSFAKDRSNFFGATLRSSN